MKSFILSTVFCFGLIASFSQQSVIGIEFENVKVEGNVMENLASGEWRIRFNTNQVSQDSIHLDILHAKGDAPRARVKWVLKRGDSIFHNGPKFGFNPGDRVVFGFHLATGYVFDNYTIKSTRGSLEKPFTLEVVYIYNNDTLNSNLFTIPSKLNVELRPKSILLSTDEANKFNAFLLVHKERKFYCPIKLSSLFHGKVFVNFTENRKLLKDQLTNFNWMAYNLDTDDGLGSGHNE